MVLRSPWGHGNSPHTPDTRKSMIDLARNAYRRLPDGLRYAVLVHRRAPLWRQSRIVFVHVPKSAGTSINHALYGRFMGHMRAMDIQRWAPSDVRALPSFCVTRNPWERLVSAYSFAREGTGEGKLAGMWRPERYRIPAFRSFETFVKEWLVHQNLSRLDGVFRLQRDFICGQDNEILVDHVGRLDNLEPTRDFIRRHCGWAPEFAHTNRSRNIRKYQDYYTPDLRDIVGNIYRDDIELLGYAF